jgi:hypothetical protein
MTPEQDNKVEIPLEFSDAELLTLFKQAHELDLTFNQFVEQALLKFLEQHDNLLNKQDGSVASGLVQSTWPYPESN